ncbi:60S ribosomal protein L24 [Zancudomyces culisetae]|uniref:60S ribosomal protein L24 n=1 Tax=Zancudomyces culisetae TaxID=1213189 RepID=A0A1R1PEY7_ZANCU|nr:60S ribosomal protein L24 [Zancudomyces culisetae]|eukprot:OMH79560.1 60S ribosomal protein L24 [Zancudomyces culisetae]
MRLEICSFSGSKIYPGHGRTFVRGDSRIFHFLNSKTESLFHQAKNPRKIAWTVVYRGLHRKGISEEVAKKRTRRAVKYNRAIVGVSWEAIQSRRSEKPEVRAAARTAAITKAKEAKKTVAAEKAKANKQNKPQVSKTQAKPHSRPVRR